MTRKKFIAIILLLLPILVLIRFVVTLGPENDQQFIVTRIIDGDTVELNGSDLVRLLGIDTPERGEPYYDSAKVFLADLIKGDKIDLRFDHRRRDGYGRMLAYIYSGSTLVNCELVKAGYARLYLFKDNLQNENELPKLIEAQRDAIEKRIGIWNLDPDDEQYYIANNSTLRLHRPTCRAAEDLSESKKEQFDSRLAAYYYGYSPCRNCKP